MFIVAATEYVHHPMTGEGRVTVNDGDKKGNWNIYQDGKLIGTRPWNWQPVEVENGKYDKKPEQSILQKIKNIFINE
ncbi:hypothetical protein J2X31_003290 [Flavobacterium arsenatis]|uniref:Uncharacterized protein n=1 Tax=Flavobacterium arsenatis TaxID=1484332 RepID=A0ABU1TTQ6_9FLAO|nr:hypothetical protein [Flavobacterium arsenatis]MDR6969263.1 hypothetical protein [Flavobacterium arsenatis]